MSIRAWLANGPAASAFIHPRLRRLVLNGLGARIGRSGIMHGVRFGGDLSKLRIGDHTFINAGVSLILPAESLSATMWHSVRTY